MKFLVYETRPEVIVYEIEAADAADAENRYLTDGDEVSSYLADGRDVTVELKEEARQ